MMARDVARRRLTWLRRTSSTASCGKVLQMRISRCLAGREPDPLPPERGVEGARLFPPVTSHEPPVEQRQDAPRVGDPVVLQALRVCTCRQFPQLRLRAAGVDAIDFALESDGGD